MAVTLNAKGTSVPYFTIGKNGTTLYQGSSDPSGSYTVHNGDLWIDGASNALKVRSSGSWLPPALGPLSFPNSTGTSGQILTADGTGGLYFSSTGAGSVTSVSVVSANGFAGSVATATSTPAITLSTSVSGILKGNGTAISAASAGDFPILNQNTTGSAASLTTARSITATGDASWTVNFDGSTNVSAGLTLATVNSNTGAFGSAASVPVFTVNGKGLITAVTDTSIQIAETQITNGTILARVADNETITGNWTFNNPVVGADPTSASNFATKQYVDNAVAGLTWKSPVLVATTADITLSGTQTIDGVAVTAGNRVLVKNQSTSSQNGIYVVSAGAWTRSTDFDSVTPIDEINGAAVFVTAGSTQSDTGWTETALVTTVGTDPITFVQFSAAGAYTAGAGLSLTGNTFNVGTASSSRIVVNVDDIDLATVTDSGTGTFLKLTRDSYGRVTGTTAVVASDITGLVNSTYVAKAGDTMSGALQVNSTFGATGTATLNGVTNVGGGVSAGNYVFRALSATGDRLRIASLAAGSGALIDVTDSGETTTARPLTLGASNSNVYLGSSTQFTKTAAGNVGIGGTPNANWRAGAYALQMGVFPTFWQQSNGSANVGFGLYEGGTNTFNYLTTGDPPTLYSQISGRHRWFNAAAGTANGSVSLTEVMALDTAGNLMLGSVGTAYAKLDVTGAVHVNSTNALPGLYLQALGDNEASLSGGAQYNSYSAPNYVFTARATTASGYRTSAGTHTWWGNTGLTSGNTFNSTDRMTLDASGNLTVGTNVSIGNDLVGRGTSTTIYSSLDTGYTALSGGNGVGSGANIVCYGSTHATLANIGRLRTGTNVPLEWTTNSVSITGSTVITNTGQAQLQIVGTDTGATGPRFTLYHDSTSPAASDTVGEIRFNGNDSAAAAQIYGQILTQIVSPTATAESSQMRFVTLSGGSTTVGLTINQGEVILQSVDISDVYSAGYRGLPQNSKSAAYTLVLSDAGKHIYHPSADTTARTWTIPSNASVAFPIGTTVTFVNDSSAGSITIAITTDTLVLAGTGATGSRTLAANGIATAIKVTATRWMISGTNLT